jgi:hypothetical protein
MDIPKRSKEGSERFFRDQRGETPYKNSSVVGIGGSELLAVGANKIAENGSCLRVVFPRLFIDKIAVGLAEDLTELGLAE